MAYTVMSRQMPADIFSIKEQLSLETSASFLELHIPQPAMMTVQTYCVRKMSSQDNNLSVKTLCKGKTTSNQNKSESETSKKGHFAAYMSNNNPVIHAYIKKPTSTAQHQKPVCDGKDPCSTGGCQTNPTKNDCKIWQAAL